MPAHKQPTSIRIGGVMAVSLPLHGRWPPCNGKEQTEQDDSNGKEPPTIATVEVVNVQEPSTEMLDNEA